MEFHPVSMIYPLLKGDDFRQLKEDIAQNGQREPIYLHPDGSILDGRNRYRAIEELEGIEARYEQYQGELDALSLISFVRSLNEKRRHLDSSQLACVAVECEELIRKFEKEARENQNQANSLLRNEKGQFEPVSQQIDTLVSTNGRTTEKLASTFNTNREYVHTAKVLKKEAPRLFDQAKDGTRNLRNVWREYKQSQDKEQMELPTSKYRVIYADPPWKYGNNMPEEFHEQADHYPLMTIKEIAALPIKNICMDNAVLFLWVTSPILDECFEVVKAWGFTYKSSFIWDKVNHVMGHYNSVRHEILLICTRGSCMPDIQKLFDSVQTIPSDKKKHSGKPEEFRVIIDTIYPNGKRIELFSRNKVENWDVYGNERILQAA